MFGYLNAVYDYHTDPDLGKYHFSTVCWQSMRGSISNHRKAQQRLKRNAQTISIEELRQKAVQTDIAHNEQLAQFQMRMLMLDLASTVSNQHMDVVKLKYQGHGVREIAGVLNLTVKEVRSLLAQARDVLMELCYGCRLLP